MNLIKNIRDSFTNKYKFIVKMKPWDFVITSYVKFIISVVGTMFTYNSVSFFGNVFSFIYEDSLYLDNFG